MTLEPHEVICDYCNGDGCEVQRVDKCIDFSVAKDLIPIHIVNTCKKKQDYPNESEDLPNPQAIPRYKVIQNKTEFSPPILAGANHLSSAGQCRASSP